MNVLRAGDRVDRYVVDALIGRGGMAAVYRAHHAELGSVHALKILTLPSEALAERLVHEGRMQGRLRHPNVVGVSDAVRVGDTPVLVVELVDGPNLADWLAQARPTLAQVDALARGILAGMDAAHRQGLLHRDLKPANVLLQVTPTDVVPKIGDFGLARLTGDAPPRAFLTREGTSLGTPVYMPPEQAVDATKVGPQADVFSLGAVLLELVLAAVDAPVVPFALLEALREGRPPPLDSLASGVPVRWRRAILAALSLDPADRPADAGALRERWIGGAMPLDDPWPPAALASAASMAPGGSRPPTLAAPAVRRTPPPKRTPWLMLGILGAGGMGAVVVAAAGAALLFLAPRGPTYATSWETVGGTLGLRGERKELPPLGEVAWRVTRKDDAVRLDRVNGRGNLYSWDATDQDRPVTLRVVQGSEGISRLTQLAETGEVVHQVEVRREDDTLVLRHLDRDGEPAPSPWIEDLGGGLGRHARPTVEILDLDPAGRVERRTWRSASGLPERGADGSWGVAYERDGEGRVVRRTALGPDGRATRDAEGVITVALRYEDPRFPEAPTRVELRGLGDLPALAPGGWHAWAGSYAEDGRLLSERWEDTDGQPTRGEDGCFERVWGWTDDASDVGCRDASGAPLRSDDGWAGRHTRYDTRGYPVEVSFTDPAGAPTVDTRGAWRSLRAFDDLGRLVELGPATDVEGSVTRAGRAAPILRYTLDPFGQAAEVAFLDGARQPTSGWYGAHVVTERITPTGAELEVAAWDATGAPWVTPEGWHRRASKVDAHGEALEIELFGPTGERVNGSAGWARRVYTRNEAGEELEVQVTDVAGNLVVDPEKGYARRVRTFDERGFTLSSETFGADGRPIVTGEGWARQDMTWDGRGLVASTTFYGADGERIRIRTGFHSPSKAVYTYDAAGRTTRVTQYDEHDQLLTDDCATVETIFDTRGFEAGYRCLDAEDRPRVAWGRASEVRGTLDASGRELAIDWRGPDGKPAIGPEGVAGVRNVLDGRGVVRTRTTVGVDGALLDAPAGYARLETVVDDRGGLLEQACFRADGSPARGESGWARLVTTRDAAGRTVEERFYDTDGALMQRGVAVARHRYEGGVEVEVERLDAAGRPVE